MDLFHYFLVPIFLFVNSIFFPSTIILKTLSHYFSLSFSYNNDVFIYAFDMLAKIKIDNLQYIYARYIDYLNK